MPRSRRRDYPGALHHVRVRGAGQRAIFESRRDIRVLLALMACAVRAGRLEILAYAIMTNHFHLFVRSPEGRLHRAMQWILGHYGSYFNRTRGKHGSIGEGRFRSKLVESWSFERALVWYMDRNPIEAGLVDSPERYPYSSAQHYVRNHGPPWLSRGRIEAMVQRLSGAPKQAPYAPRHYLRVIPRRPNPGLKELLERAISSPNPAPLADLDDLLGAAQPHVQDWLARNAANADGSRSRVLVAAAGTVTSLLEAARSNEPGRMLRVSRRKRPMWDVMESGLLHTVCGLTIQQIAERLGVSLSTAHAHVCAHRQALRHCNDYLETASIIVKAALDADYGELGDTTS